jgi:hypothetical protein
VHESTYFISHERCYCYGRQTATHTVMDSRQLHILLWTADSYTYCYGQQTATHTVMDGRQRHILLWTADSDTYCYGQQTATHTVMDGRQRHILLWTADSDTYCYGQQTVTHTVMDGRQLHILLWTACGMLRCALTGLEPKIGYRYIVRCAFAFCSVFMDISPFVCWLLVLLLLLYNYFHY